MKVSAKNGRFLIMGVVLLVVALLMSCATPTPAPTPTPTPTPSPTPTPAKVFELKFGHQMAPVMASAKVYEEWTKKIEAQTQGRVKITIFPSQSLFATQDTYASVVGRIGDIGHLITINETERLPLNCIQLQPSVYSPANMDAARMWKELYNKFPEMRNELAELKLITTWAMPGEQLLNLTTKDKEVRVPNDVRGMKILANGPHLEVLRLAGASPIPGPPTEWAMSLQRGLAQGAFSQATAVDIFGCSEVLPYHLNDVIRSTQLVFVVMNLGTWNSLPPDIQKIIDDLSPWLTEATYNADRGYTLGIKQKWTGLGHTIIETTPGKGNCGGRFAHH